MLFLISIAVVGASLLGGLVPLRARLTHTRLQVYLSISAGAMLGAAFFHMMPEAVEHGSPQVLRWSAAGLLSLFFLERFFAYHQHETPPLVLPDEAAGGAGGVFGSEGCGHGHGQGHAHGHGPVGVENGSGVQKGSLQWGAALIGLTIHSLTGGVALASAWAIGGSGERAAVAAWGVFLASVIHKPADALTIVSLMLRAGLRPWAAHLANVGFAMMVPLGMALFLGGMSWLEVEAGAEFTAAALAFSAGTFLCIALGDLLPELSFHRHDRVKLSLALLAGFGLMALTEYWHIQVTGGMGSGMGHSH